MLTWTDSEVRAFLDFTAEHTDYAMWRTTLMTGMRRGEVLGQRRLDLQLDRVLSGQSAPALNVRQQYSRAGDEGLALRSLKTSDRAWRTIDLDEVRAAVLRRHLDVQEFQRRSWVRSTRASAHAAGGRSMGAAGPVGSRRPTWTWCSAIRMARPSITMSATHRFERRAQLCAGVVRIRFHDMRHTHATLLLEDGATERYVTERLGDTVEMIHETYGHVTPKMRIAAVERLAKRLRRPR
jgi:integrase